ncbi:hypothetical protein [Cyclobacterium sp. SYSU L10401]|uniref:hypothetical protein n=1 Tax=Cyclobacterium sp. SYSU L10401 TaxID=2678657 RepID=UPI0013D6E209|nr:hypothetical protein [Cyclobacterium sp. SYSU L10401]
MKKVRFQSLILSVPILLICLSGCKEDIEPTVMKNPDLIVFPSEERQHAIVGQIINFEVLLSGEGATFTSLNVIQSYGSNNEVFELIDNPSSELLSPPLSETFDFEASQSMAGKDVSLTFIYQNTQSTNSGGTIQNSGQKVIKIMVSE